MRNMKLGIMFQSDVHPSTPFLHTVWYVFFWQPTWISYVQVQYSFFWQTQRIATAKWQAFSPLGKYATLISMQSQGNQSIQRGILPFIP